MAPVLLLHWNWSEVIDLAGELQHYGWDVITESDDGVRAVQLALEHPPVVLAISLRAAPAHGRDVALALLDHPEGRAIPIVFFDGDERAWRKVRRAIPDAAIIGWEELPSVIARLAGSSSG